MNEFKFQASVLRLPPLYLLHGRRQPREHLAGDEQDGRDVARELRAPALEVVAGAAVPEGREKNGRWLCRTFKRKLMVEPITNNV